MRGAAALADRPQVPLLDLGLQRVRQPLPVRGALRRALPARRHTSPSPSSLCCSPAPPARERQPERPPDPAALPSRRHLARPALPPRPPRPSATRRLRLPLPHLPLHHHPDVSGLEPLPEPSPSPPPPRSLSTTIVWMRVLRPTRARGVSSHPPPARSQVRAAHVPRPQGTEPAPLPHRPRGQLRVPLRHLLRLRDGRAPAPRRRSTEPSPSLLGTVPQVAYLRFGPRVSDNILNDLPQSARGNLARVGMSLVAREIWGDIARYGEIWGDMGMSLVARGVSLPRDAPARRRPEPWLVSRGL